MKKVACILLSLLLLANISGALAWGESYADKYEKAIELLVNSEYAQAGSAFAELGGYQDAPRYVMYCSAVAAGEAGQYSTAVENLNALSGFLDSTLLATYYAGISYEAVEKYERASEILGAISLYRDVSVRLAAYPAKILARDYRIADGYEQDGQLEQALDAFLALGTYQDSAERAAAVQVKIEERDAALAEARRAAAYEAADLAEKEERLEDALAGFLNLGSYRDSADRAAAVQVKIEERDAALAEARRAAAYEAADQAEKDGDYAAAYTGFSGLGDYRDSAARAEAVQTKGNYALGLQHARDGEFTKALEIFTALGDYEDCTEKVYVLGVVTFAEVHNRGDGMAAFRYHDLYGIINVNTNTIASPYWESVGSFNEHGLAVVTKSGREGYINAQGEVVIPCEWKEVSAFSGDFCTVMTGSSDNYRYGIMDKNGNTIIPAEYAVVGNAANGRYSDCETPAFSEGRIKVQDTNGNWGFIDEQGQAIGTISWKLISDFSEGRFKVQDANGNWGFIDEQGQVIGTVSWKSISNFSEGLAGVSDGSKYGFIDKEGNVIIEPQYNDFLSFSEGLAAVKVGSLWQYINRENQVIIPDRYSSVTSFKNGCADVFLDGVGWQIIDNTGKLLYFINQQTEDQYQQALQLIAEEKYGPAIPGLVLLKGYKDADALLEECKTHVVFEYSVTSLGSYGFEENSSGYFESQNKGVDNSYALCRIDVTSATGKVYLDCINYAEQGYDYGIISRPNQALSMDALADDPVAMSFKEISTSNIQTVEIDVVPDVTTSIYVKFIKDGSKGENFDSLQFSVRFY